jgi:hypothetical protein
LRARRHLRRGCQFRVLAHDVGLALALVAR